MKPLRLCLALLVLLLPFLTRAGGSFVYLGDTSKLFYALNNEIYSPNKKELLYFQKGNIFFTGEVDGRDNIFLMVSSLNINSDKLELIYEKNAQQPAYSFSGNKFYLGNSENEDFKNTNELLHIERRKKWLAFYSSVNDSLLAYYNADSLPTSAAIIVAYTLIKKYYLASKVDAKASSLNFIPDNPGFATIKPMWGNQTENEWLWDGKVLRPRWNVDQRLQWTFDGQTIKPLYGSNIYAQYSWDGENFKSVWRNNRNEEWTWDGRLMKPVYDTDWAHQYVIENGVVKPWSNVHPEREWQMQGDIPIPCLILILSGIARPF
jgi:hypothetical protein